MAKGRRSYLKRMLKRAVGNLDWYLVKIKDCLDLINSDNPELSKSFEALAHFAMILQEKTEALDKRI